MSDTRNLTPEEFISWFKGVLDASEGTLNNRQIELIKDTLQEVRKEVNIQFVPNTFTSPTIKPKEPFDIYPEITWCGSLSAGRPICSEEIS